MAKATLTTKDGTEVQVNGTVEEIARLMSLYGDGVTDSGPSKPRRKIVKRTTAKASTKRSAGNVGTPPVDHIAIVNAVKEADDFSGIEKHILDEKSQLDRCLLPLYAVQEFMNATTPLTTGDIQTVLAELGSRVKKQNVYTKLKDSKYVMPLAVRRDGAPTPYRINRQGTKYLKNVIDSSQGSGDAA